MTDSTQTGKYILDSRTTFDWYRTNDGEICGRLVVDGKAVRGTEGFYRSSDVAAAAQNALLVSKTL